MTSDEKIAFLEKHIKFWQGCYDDVSYKLSDVYGFCVDTLDDISGSSEPFDLGVAAIVTKIMSILDSEDSDEFEVELEEDALLDDSDE